MIKVCQLICILKVVKTFCETYFSTSAFRLQMETCAEILKREIHILILIYMAPLVCFLIVL